MEAIVKDQTILVDSSKAEGANYDCVVTFPSRAIQCKHDQQLRIRLQSFVTWNSFESINTSNNIIRFVRDADFAITDITIPTGNYKLRELAAKITELFPDVTVEFLPITNKFKFTFTEDYWISSVEESWRIIGFDEGSHFAEPTIESQYAIELEPVKSIVLEVDGVSTVGNMALDNRSGVMKNSSVLMQIPITSDWPYCPIVYNSADGTNLYVNDKDITWMRFRLRTMEGVPLTSMPTWYATLCVETIDTSTNVLVVQTLQDLLEFQRLEFLRKSINHRG
jgi:hypothetical protein